MLGRRTIEADLLCASRQFWGLQATLASSVYNTDPFANEVNPQYRGYLNIRFGRCYSALNSDCQFGSKRTPKGPGIKELILSPWYYRKVVESLRGGV
jgi:hypothetical protein